MGKKIGIGIGAFVGVIIIALVVVFVIVTRPPSLPPPRTPDPGSSAASGTPLPPLQDQLKSVQDAVKQAQTTGQPVPVEITLTEAAANDELARRIAAGPTTGDIVIHGGRLYFDNGRASVTIAVSYQGLAVTLNVVTTASIIDGKPQLTTESIDVGGLPLPDALKSQISGMVNKEVNNIVGSFISGSQGVTFTSVDIGYMYLKLTGVAPAKK